MSSVAATRPNSVASYAQPCGERHLDAVVDRVDDVAHRDRRLPGERVRERAGFRHQLGGRDDAIDQTRCAPRRGADRPRP